MKKLFVLATLTLFTLSASAQGLVAGIFDRFRDADEGKAVFIEKGHRSLGIQGGFRQFSAGGDAAGDGFAVLSLLNIGDGALRMYNVSPRFNYFVADDLALGVRLDYSGYTLDTDLRLNLNELFNVSGISEDDPELQDELSELLNLRLFGRHMTRNSWGASLTLRKYIPFFGSKTFAVFGEGRLYGNYAQVRSLPMDANGSQNLSKLRTTNVFGTGLKIAAGVCVRLRKNNAVFVSVPVVGATYQYTKQYKAKSNNNAHLSQFKIARDIDYLAIEVGYSHFIQTKKK